LKVLHISDNSLPDSRVEKMAYLSRKRDWATFFAGPGFSYFALGGNVFDSLFFVPWDRYTRLGFPPYFFWIKRKVKKIVDYVKPDVIHAHNIFAAKMICDMGYPFVFDDHELASMEKKSTVDWELNDLSDRTVGRYEVWNWSRWERKLSLEAPVITVSDGIAEYYTKLGARTFVVPNYPSAFELSNARLHEEKDKIFTVVYLGSDISAPLGPYRDVRGITDVFKELGIRLVVIGDVRLSSNGVVVSENYIPHLGLYHAMSKYHVGLLPWKKHWFHRYANPNKPYMYTHSGMVVIVTASLRNVIMALGKRARTIEDYSDLKETLLGLSQDVSPVLTEGENNKKFAGKYLLLDRYEDQVVEAYKNAS